MSEPPPSTKRPIDVGKLIGGIFLGLIGFFVVGAFVLGGIASVTGETVGLWLGIAVLLGLLGWIYTLLRARDRSLALGLLVGVGCALLLFGTCVALLMNTSFQ